MFETFKQLFTNTNNNNLKEIINEGAFLVDVRTPEEFSQGSVKGAINVPLDRISSQLEKFRNKKHIVVFCRSGARSGQAKAMLEQKNIQNVINGGSWINVKEATNE